MPSPSETARHWNRAPFDTPFEVSAKHGRLWIRPRWAAPGSDAEQELHIRGVCWSGFESRLACPEQRDLYTYEAYMDSLAAHGFNAVRFPLNGATAPLRSTRRALLDLD